MRRNALLASVLGASLLLGTAGAVAADQPGTYVLDVFFCALTDIDGNPVDGNAVPAGSEILLFEGWAAKSRGQVQGFVNNGTWVLIVDGQGVDVTPYLSGVIDVGFIAFDAFTVSAGTLAADQTLHTTYDLVLKSASFDGFGHYAKGSLYDGGINCTVTAA